MNSEHGGIVRDRTGRDVIPIYSVHCINKIIINSKRKDNEWNTKSNALFSSSIRDVIPAHNFINVLNIFPFLFIFFKALLIIRNVKLLHIHILCSSYYVSNIDTIKNKETPTRTELSCESGTVLELMANVECSYKLI